METVIWEVTREETKSLYKTSIIPSVMAVLGTTFVISVTMLAEGTFSFSEVMKFFPLIFLVILGVALVYYFGVRAYPFANTAYTIDSTGVAKRVNGKNKYYRWEDFEYGTFYRNIISSRSGGKSPSNPYNVISENLIVLKVKRRGLVGLMIKRFLLIRLEEEIKDKAFLSIKKKVDFITEDLPIKEGFGFYKMI